MSSFGGGFTIRYFAASKKNKKRGNNSKINLYGIKKLINLEKLINSELASKIQNSKIENNELLVEISDNDLVEVINFLKSNDSCKFRQLIDIAGVDYPENEKRFQLVYLFLSHENNTRIKLKIELDASQQIQSITKIFPSANWMEREVLICMV